MTDMLIQRITEIKLMPIAGVSIYANDGDGAGWTHFRNVTSESSFSIEPITRPSSRGGEVTVGYNNTITLYVPHSPFSLFGAEPTDETERALARIMKLEAVESYTTFDVDTHLLFGNQILGSTDFDHVYNATKSAYIDFGRMQMTWKQESREFFIMTILTFKNKSPRKGANISVSGNTETFGRKNS